ncbi:MULTISPECIES: toll/interleukin-1 receptor domain-containing protein [unclassified Streptomyces]|uniref:toll/interleukin-1 receptor domain-containing protein n=1 Tax=unclassified Streptomyces TaxID=2593676 RepID=UPI0036FA97F8
MHLIFVNYRTEDEEATATLVERELSRIFGDENVFRASKSIGPGSRYPQEILTAVRRCRVLLAVVGPRWLEARSADGAAALENPDDWTRREILEAFVSGAVVIPVLVARTERLRAADLPPELGVLADCQYRRFDHRNADADLSRLADDLIGLLPELAEAARRNGYAPRASARAEGERVGDDQENGTARVRADVINHRQRGGIGNLNGDFSGTFISEPQGPVHTGNGHIFQTPEPHPDPRFSRAGRDIAHGADNRGASRQRSIRGRRSAGTE